MKHIKYIGWGLLVMILLTYGLGWIDLINNKMLTGNWFKDFLKSITYYIGWVLPYWWLIILIGTTIVFAIIIGVKAVVAKVRELR